MNLASLIQLRDRRGIVYDRAARRAAFSKFKALLKKAVARTIDDLLDRLAQGLPQLIPDDCASYFTAAGYGPV
jgi:hypothetical protein